MPAIEVAFEFQAFRWDEPPITDVEFLDPLEIVPGEVESACSWQETWGQPHVRIATVRSERPVPDAEFDAWVAPACRAVVRFLRSRPVGLFDRLRASGMQNLRLCADQTYVGDSPMVDFPQEVYDACRDAGIGFVSGSEKKDRTEPEPSPPAEGLAPQPFPAFKLIVPPRDPRDWLAKGPGHQAEAEPVDAPDTGRG